MDLIKAFIEFLTDLFAALADFLGWTIDLDAIKQIEDDLDNI